MSFTTTNLASAVGTPGVNLAVGAIGAAKPVGTLFLLFIANSDPSGVALVSDPQGNTWNSVTTTTFNNGLTANGFGVLKFCYITTQYLSTDTVSVGFTAGNSAASLDCVDGTDPILNNLQGVSVTGSSTAPSATLTGVTPGSYVVGFLSQNASATDTFTQAAGFAVPPTRVGNGPTVAGGWISAASTNITYAPTITSRPWGVTLAEFAGLTNAVQIYIDDDYTNSLLIARHRRNVRRIPR